MEPHPQGGAWCTGPSHSHSTSHRDKHIKYIAHTCVPSLAHSTPMCVLRLMLQVVCSVPSAEAPISGAFTADRISVVGLEPYWIGVRTQTASSRAAQGAQFNFWTSHQRPPSLCVQGGAGELCRPGNVGSGLSRALMAFREGRGQAEDFGGSQESIVPVGLCVD